MQTPAGDGRWRGACGRSSLPSKGRAGPGTHSPGNQPSSSALAVHRRPQGGARGSRRPLASGHTRRREASVAGGAHGAASSCPRRARGSVARSSVPIVCAVPRRAAGRSGPASPCSPGSGGSARPGRGQPRPRPTCHPGHALRSCLGPPGARLSLQATPTSSWPRPCRVRSRPVLDSARLQPRSAPVCARPPPPRSRPSAKCQQVWSELGAQTILGGSP